MIFDYEQELTVVGGHDLAFAAGSEYGSKPYDSKIPLHGLNDVGVGDPLDVFIDTMADAVTLTDCTVAIVADTDGAGGSEVVLVSKLFARADITVAKGLQRVGRIGPGSGILITHKYLSAKLTITGATGTGKVKVLLMKASDAQPHNTGRVI